MMATHTNADDVYLIEVHGEQKQLVALATFSVVRGLIGYTGIGGPNNDTKEQYELVSTEGAFSGACNK
jgi:hypothetical protein